MAGVCCRRCCFKQSASLDSECGMRRAGCAAALPSLALFAVAVRNRHRDSLQQAGASSSQVLADCKVQFKLGWSCWMNSCVDILSVARLKSRERLQRCRGAAVHGVAMMLRCPFGDDIPSIQRLISDVRPTPTRPDPRLKWSTNPNEWWRHFVQMLQEPYYAYPEAIEQAVPAKGQSHKAPLPSHPLKTWFLCRVANASRFARRRKSSE